MINEEMNVAICRNPFLMERIDSVVSNGTITELLEQIDAPRNNTALCVMINDEPINPISWDYRRPLPGDVVYVRVLPMGFGSFFRAILMIAVVVAASLIAPGVGTAISTSAMSAGLSAATWSTIAFVSINAIGMLAVNAIAPPVMPQVSALGGTGRIAIGSTSGLVTKAKRSSFQESPSLSGGNNQLDPYGPIPRPLGRHKLIPPFGAKTYTEIAGDDQYQRMLFVLGYGPLDISNMKFGDTDIDDFDEVEYEVRQGFPGDGPLTLFTNSVDEKALEVHLEQVNSWAIRTTAEDTNEISIDITFPRGLLEINETTGNEQNRTVSVQWEYSVAGADAWSGVRTITTTEARAATIRKNDRVTGLDGQYDVRIRRTTGDTDNTRIADKVYWTALRSIESVYPIGLPGLALVAVRIKASDQFSGIVDTFNCVVHSLVDDWTGAAWVEQITNNPASLYRQVLQGAANKKAVADGRINLTKLQEWHDFCVTNGFTYNSPGDFQSSVQDMLREIAAAGRASPTYFDGRYSIIFDQEQTIPRQHISPRNSWDFSAQKVFAKLPHALRIRFANEDKNWQEDECIVYDEGYDEDNTTVFEQLPLPGVTEPDLAWKHGRYHIACARLRPEMYTWFMDIEHLVCTRGDMIRFSHDVTLSGIKWGRVKELQVDNGNTTGVTIDQEFAMETGKSYSIRFRKATGASVVTNIVTDVGNQTTVVFSNPIVTADGPAVGDLGLFGLAGIESVELLIRDIIPQADLSAKILAIDAAPAVYTSDTGTIPAFDSQITLPYDVPKTIGSPSIRDIQSDGYFLIRSTDGTLVPRVVISFDWKSGELFDQIKETEILYRLADSVGSWERLAFGKYISEVSIIGVDDGRYYDIRMRYTIIGDQAGPWTEINNYLVIGQTGSPPDVTTFFLENDHLRWTYPIEPKDFGGFRIRFRAGTNRAWADATPAHDDLIKGSTFPKSNLPTGLLTIMIKAEDVTGNQSENVAVIVKDLGDPKIANVITTYDYAANNFPGTITDGTIAGTNLEADGAGTIFWNLDDNSLFWDADGISLFWDSLYLEMIYEFDFTLDIIDLPSQLSLDYNITGSPWSIYIKSNGDTIFWNDPDTTLFWDADDASLFWDVQGEWVSWPGYIDETSRQRYLFKIVTGAGTVQGIIYDLEVQIDVPDIEEILDDVIIADTGTRLPIAESYREIVAVQLTLQDDGGDAVSVKTADKDIAGPLVEARDVIEVLTAATVDAFVQGY